MFTMDDWLGLLGLILLVAVCLYVVYVVLTAIALVWPRRQPERASPVWAHTSVCVVCGMYDYSCDCGPIFPEEPRTREQPPLRSQPIPRDRDLLDTIIRDLREAIVLEHLEIRTRNRFAAILNRLENYRDS